MEECVACKAKNVKQESINLLHLVYLVDRTTLKDQFDIKVSTLFRNMCEEGHAEEHTQVTTTMTITSNLNAQMLEHTRIIEANQALFMGTLKLSRTVKDHGRH